jgi:hypothetical protein
MLHIRVVTTPGLTGRLLDRLADLPGIRTLIVLEGGTLLIVVGAGGLSAQRALWARPYPPKRPD